PRGRRLAWLGRAGLALVRLVGRLRFVPRLGLPERLRRELLALAALTGAALVTVPLLGLTQQVSLAGLVSDGLRAVFGAGAFLVPLALVWLAGEALFGGEGRARRALGAVLLLAVAVTYLDLLDAAGRLGGYLGAALGSLTMEVAGRLGAGILVFSLALAALYLLTGADARGVIESWRAIRARRAERRSARLAAVPSEPSPAPEPEPAPAPEPLRPVIKVPQRAARAQDDNPITAPTGPLPLPEIGKLALYEGGAPNELELEGKAERIEETLGNFKVDARVREVYPGPAVTLFALEPGPGVKVKRITELQNDLALALAAHSIRIEAPVPGKARVGIEIPNSSVHTIGLRETLEASEFQSSKARVPLALGRDVNGDYVVADLARMPHLLIAGSTGSGKSVAINSIIATFLLTRQPEELQMVLVDPKMVELVGYNGVPHLKCPVVTEMDKVVGTLRLVVKEMEDRYQRFSSLGVRNIDGYKLKRQDDPSLEELPYLIVIIDELADLMMTTPEEVETLLVRLAQMARATGIHLLIATQRPSVDVLTGLIKTNIPARIAFAVTSLTDSRVILDLPGAERLLGRGDMLFLPPDAAKPQRVQGSYIEDRDLQYVVRHWQRVRPDFDYDPEWQVTADEEGEGGDDPLMEQALKVVRQHGTASASMLQRRLRIGYNRASRLIEQMEDEGIVGPADGSRGRPVYLDEDDS
ncbi:MAG TPA: DNA translocase FtsK 4TM domain-containing protein, partial [Nitrolancea sp.]|nr:DNA translocase FtsK 4TM domain-containing protein [Nitrolancea sp.]